MIRKYTIPIVLLMLLMASPAQALHWDLAFRYCPIQIVDIPKLVEELPVPVGCEIVDCCPGCPGPGPIDWRIRIDPETLGGAELRFDGLDRGQLAKLKIEGDARLTDNGSFLLGTGDIAIFGLPAGWGGKAAVGVIVPRALEDHDVNKAGKADSDEGDFYDGIANANLLYKQNDVGVQFNETIQNVSANATAVATIDTWCPTAATVGNLQGSAWCTANTLNAY